MMGSFGGRLALISDFFFCMTRYEKRKAKERSMHKGKLKVASTGGHAVRKNCKIFLIIIIFSAESLVE